MQLPPEDPRYGEPGLCGRLKMSLYGTQDAGANWHKAYSDFLKSIGMRQGIANPCHFTNLEKGLRGIVHGDDFLFTGALEDLRQLQKKFESQYACKVEIIGNSPGMPKSARFLNRVITFCSDEIQFEADQRLAEAIIKGMEVDDGTAYPYPGTKPKPVTKAAQQQAMERRIGSEGGGCVIANLKAQIGALESEVARLKGNTERKGGKQKSQDGISSRPMDKSKSHLENSSSTS